MTFSPVARALIDNAATSIVRQIAGTRPDDLSGIESRLSGQAGFPISFKFMLGPRGGIRYVSGKLGHQPRYHWTTVVSLVDLVLDNELDGAMASVLLEIDAEIERCLARAKSARVLYGSPD